MIVLPEFQCVYVHPPKSGGTSVTMALAPYTGLQYAEDPAKDRAWHPKFHVGRMHEPVPQSRIPRGYKVFLTVRNPYARALSHYLALKPSEDRLRNKRPWNLLAAHHAFPEWLDETWKQQPIPRGLYGPMADYAEVLDSPIILHQEDLEREFAAMCAEEGWPFELPAKRLNPSRFQVNAREFFQDAAARGMVLKHYADDFRLFGYSTDPDTIGEAP